MNYSQNACTGFARMIFSSRINVDASDGQKKLIEEKKVTLPM